MQLPFSETPLYEVTTFIVSLLITISSISLAKAMEKNSYISRYLFGRLTPI